MTLFSDQRVLTNYP